MIQPGAVTLSGTAAEGKARFRWGFVAVFAEVLETVISRVVGSAWRRGAVVISEVRLTGSG